MLFQEGDTKLTVYEIKLRAVMYITMICSLGDILNIKL
jgi:hypothetical protein